MKYSPKSVSLFLVVSLFVFIQFLSQCPMTAVSAQEINSDLPICNKSQNYFVLNSSLSVLQNFTSENYPQDYPQYSNCIWLLTAPIGQLIKLTFSMFSIYSQTDSSQCPYAYLQVVEIDSNGNEETIGRFCGSQTPETIYSSGGNLRVVFKNTLLTKAKGFVALYSAVQTGMACSALNSLDENSNILVKGTTKGHIKAPLAQFPKSFSAPVDCTWKITLPPKNGVNISFLSFTSQKESSCSESALEVYNGHFGHGHGNRLGLFCEKVDISHLYSSGRYLSLRWRAKSPKTAVNFEVKFMSFQQTMRGSCEDVHNNQIYLEGLAGSMFSPGYPLTYPNSKECVWRISVPAGLKVKLQFVSFQLEAGSSCSDFVEVKDGDSKSSSLLEKLCGSVLPNVLISGSRDMYIKFKSNFATSGKGFLAMFEATSTQAPQIPSTPGVQPGVCSPTNSNNINNNLKLSGPSGYVSSPRYPSQYPNSISCTWRIQVEKGKRILLEFQDFWIDDQRGCRGDYLEIRDGTSESSSLIGEKYCGNKKPGDIHSTENHMWLQFSSDASGTSHGFKAEYSAVDKPFNRFIAVGIAIGAIAFLLIIILIIWKIKKKRNKGEEDHDGDQSDIGTLDRDDTHGNALLSNNLDTPYSPYDDYDVRYQPRPVAMETMNNQEPHLRNNLNNGNDEEFAWFKSNKRKSKGFE